MKDSAQFWTRVLAVAGAVLIWLPLLAPVFFGFMSLFSNGKFLFDYLMPAEVFPSILVGTGLLIWASIRTKKYLKPILWSFVTGTALLLICQGVAVITGLADGRVQGGWQMTLVMGIYFGFLLAMLVLGVCSIFLVRWVFKKQNG
jgi:hypothetical protein